MLTAFKRGFYKKKKKKLNAFSTFYYYIYSIQELSAPLVLWNVHTDRSLLSAIDRYVKLDEYHCRN